MRRFFSFAFFSLAGFAATFALYAGFGGLAAFGVLALSDGGFRPAPAASQKLADFVASDEKSAGFSASELEGGLAYILESAARETSRGLKRQISYPAAPSADFRDGEIVLGVPFAASFAGRVFAVRARIGLDFDGGLRVASASVGKAKLPRFAAGWLADALLEMYKPLKPLDAYFAAFGKMSARVDGGTAVLEK